MSQVAVEFCGEWTRIAPGRALTIGREAELVIDEDNPFLHRRFLTIREADGMWWLINDGSRISASVTDSTQSMQATLAPGARIPIAFDYLNVVFSAGPTTYEFSIHAAAPDVSTLQRTIEFDGEPTVGAVPFTESQKLLILVLAEPLLMRDGESISTIPSSADAAAALGWTRTKFNRKLDNVCDKLDKIGVKGLRGGPTKLASNRRTRLVEYAVSSRLVDASDLALLHSAKREAAGRALSDDD